MKQSSSYDDLQEYNIENNSQYEQKINSKRLQQLSRTKQNRFQIPQNQKQQDLVNKIRIDNTNKDKMVWGSKKHLQKYIESLQITKLDHPSNKQLSQYQIQRNKDINALTKFKQGRVQVKMFSIDLQNIIYQFQIVGFNIKIKGKFINKQFRPNSSFKHIRNGQSDTCFHCKNQHHDYYLKIIKFNKYYVKSIFSIQKAIRIIAIEKLAGLFKASPLLQCFQNDTDVLVYQNCMCYKSQVYIPLILSLKYYWRQIPQDQIKKQQEILQSHIHNVLQIIHSIGLVYDNLFVHTIVYLPRTNKYVLIAFDNVKSVEQLINQEKSWTEINKMQQNQLQLQNRQLTNENLNEVDLFLDDIFKMQRLMKMIYQRNIFMGYYDPTIRDDLENNVIFSRVFKTRLQQEKQKNNLILDNEQRIEIQYQFRAQFYVKQKQHLHHYYRNKLQILDEYSKLQLYYNYKNLHKQAIFYLEKCSQTASLDNIQYYKYITNNNLQYFQGILFKNLLKVVQKYHKKQENIEQNYIVLIAKIVYDRLYFSEKQRKIYKYDSDQKIFMKTLIQIQQFLNNYNHDEKYVKFSQSLMITSLLKSLNYSQNKIRMIQQMRKNYLIFMNYQKINSIQERLKFIFEIVSAYWYILKRQGQEKQTICNQIQFFIRQGTDIASTTQGIFQQNIFYLLFDWFKKIFLFCKIEASPNTQLLKEEMKNEKTLSDCRKLSQKLNNYFGNYSVYSFEITLKILLFQESKNQLYLNTVLQMLNFLIDKTDFANIQKVMKYIRIIQRQQKQQYSIYKIGSKVLNSLNYFKNCILSKNNCTNNKLQELINIFKQASQYNNLLKTTVRPQYYIFIDSLYFIYILLFKVEIEQYVQKSLNQNFKQQMKGDDTSIKYDQFPETK